MGKIKSTLELAMERTKKFTLSEKEKEEMKQKEVLRKATSLFHRYREKHLSSNEILREIGRMEKNTSATVKELLLSQWIDALSLDDEDKRILKGVESLKERSIAEIKQRFQHLLSQYQTEKEKVREQMTVQWIEALRMEGIYGSAVDPNLEGSELWKKESERLDRSYRMKLEAIKQQLRVL
jgi:alkylation response protein AidB-like acyl-CoA dehydrogenase